MLVVFFLIKITFWFYRWNFNFEFKKYSNKSLRIGIFTFFLIGAASTILTLCDDEDTKLLFLPVMLTDSEFGFDYRFWLKSLLAGLFENRGY